MTVFDNPEFRRNLWLELSLHRLVVTPIVLGVIFTIAYLGTATIGAHPGDDRPFESLTNVARWTYFAIVFLLGGRLACASVIRECRDRTWDGQRMSALGPWAMTWAKLFGSTAFA